MAPRQRYRLANAVQIWAWIGGAALLLLLGLRLLPFGAWIVVAMLPFGIAPLLTCEKCKASYFYDEKRGNFLMGPVGFNLLRRLKPTCPRCGFDRAASNCID